MKKVKPLKLPEPIWVDHIMNDAMMYSNLASYGHTKDKKLLEEMMEQIKKTIKTVGH